MSGFGHSRSMFSLVVWACGLEFTRLCALLSTCVVFCVARGSCSATCFSCRLVLLHAVRVFIGCVHSCYVFCCVAHSLCFSLAACFHVVMSCVNTRLMSILISCVLVSCFAHGWWFLLLAMCLCFCFVWAHGFVFVFCVPCALMSIVLTPPILLPDYWLICPTCVSLVTLLICSLFILLVLAFLCQFVVVPLYPVPALPCLVLPCLVMPFLVVPCLVVPCPVLPDFFPPRGSFGCLFCFIFLINKSPSLCTTESSLHPSSPTLTQEGLDSFFPLMNEPFHGTVYVGPEGLDILFSGDKPVFSVFFLNVWRMTPGAREQGVLRVLQHPLFFFCGQL